MNRCIRVVQRIAIAAIRIDRQRTISSGKRRADRAVGCAKGYRRHRRAIRALDIGNTICSVGVSYVCAGKDVAVSYRGTIFCNAVYIGARRGDIVDDIDNQSAGFRVTVLIGDHHCKIIKDCVARSDRGQRIAVTNCTIGDAGHGQYAEVASEALAYRRHSLTVECHRSRAVRRREGNGSAGCFARGIGIRTAR